MTRFHWQIKIKILLFPQSAGRVPAVDLTGTPWPDTHEITRNRLWHCVVQEKCVSLKSKQDPQMCWNINCTAKLLCGKTEYSHSFSFFLVTKNVTKLMFYTLMAGNKHNVWLSLNQEKCIASHTLWSAGQRMMLGEQATPSTGQLQVRGSKAATVRNNHRLYPLLTDHRR